MFNKSVSQITTADLQSLLDDEAVENVRLEFKREVPKKDELLKKLSSFANTFGGYLVIGAAEEQQRGKLASYPGIEVQANYKQTVLAHCFSGTYPPINVEVSEPIVSPSDQSKVCYVIYVPVSELAPHFLNGRKGVYIRTDEHSKRFEAELADQNELLALLDRRKAIRTRRGNLIERAESRANHHCHIDTQPTLQLSVIPRFPHAPVTDLSGVKETMKSVNVRLRRDFFPYNAYKAITQSESIIAIDPQYDGSLLEFNLWGQFHYAEQIEFTVSGTETKGIHTNGFLGHTLVVLKWISLVAAKFEMTGPLLVNLKLSNILNLPWLYFRYNTAGEGPTSPLDNEISIDLELDADIVKSRPAVVFDTLMEQVFFSYNWSTASDTIPRRCDLYKSALEYNSWPTPQNIADYPDCD